MRESWPPRMNDHYVVRHPRTGKPLSTGFQHRKARKYDSAEGPWLKAPLSSILGLARGEIPYINIEWNDSEMRLTQSDGVMGLPRLTGGQRHAANSVLLEVLNSDSTDLRCTALKAMPACAQRCSDGLFEILEDLLYDGEEVIRHAAAEALVFVAETHPSGVEDIVQDALRSPETVLREAGWKAMRMLADDWPERATELIDMMLREEDVDLRARSAKLLTRMHRHGSIATLDAIGWALQDEDESVRAAAAPVLPKLASTTPRMTMIIIEQILFDECNEVQRNIIKALNRLNAMDAPRLSQLVVQAARHPAAGVRRSAAQLLIKVLGRDEARAMAHTLLRQETDESVQKILMDIGKDESLEGTERQRNRHLAPVDEAVDLNRIEPEEDRRQA